jgi:hypothetical protein
VFPARRKMSSGRKRRFRNRGCWMRSVRCTFLLGSRELWGCSCPAVCARNLTQIASRLAQCEKYDKISISCKNDLCQPRQNWRSRSPLSKRLGHGKIRKSARFRISRITWSLSIETALQRTGENAAMHELSLRNRSWHEACRVNKVNVAETENGNIFESCRLFGLTDPDF